MTDKEKKKEIRITNEVTDPVTNTNIITRTYEDNKRDFETKKDDPYAHLFGGGYSSTRSTRKKQSDDENIENK